MKFKKTISLYFLLVFAFSAFAQSNTTDLTQDSSNTQLLAQYSKKLAVIEKQRIADSIKKVELEARLNSLKTTDNLKKEELLNQIQELKNKDQKRLEAKKAKIDSLRSSVKAYPVLGFFNDTLFLIYTKSGSFSASERAVAASERIQSVGSKFLTAKDSVRLFDQETSIDILSGEIILMNVNDNDALWNNSTRNELAVTYKKIITNSLNHYQSETKELTIAKEVGLALLVIALFGLLIFYIAKIFTWSASKIKGLEDTFLSGIKIKNYTLLNSKKQVSLLLTINTFIQWLIILISVYIVLPILFGIFPWTENFADKLFGYILTPIKKIAAGLWNYLPNFFTILVILTLFYYINKVFRFLKKEIESGALVIPGFYSDWANPTYQIARVLLYAFMIVVIFPYLPGSDSPVFQGVSVFLGFYLRSVLQDSLSNIIAGIVLTYMRLFKIGDRVKIGDVTGDIIEKSLLVTRIRTLKNEIISIPNSSIMNSHTTNYSSDTSGKGLIIHTTVTIGYDVPWEDMHQALIDAASLTNNILKEPKPFVLQTSLDDFYVSYQINVYTKEPNKQAFIYSDLHQNIQDICNARGIEIMSPHYKASRDGNTSTIPASYLPPDYKAPGFNIHINNKP